MSKTFYELSDYTKKKWTKRNNVAAEVALRKSGDEPLVKDVILGHMQEVWEAEGTEWVENRENYNFKMMKAASIYSGTDSPSLDMIWVGYKDCRYIWLRNGEIPLGSLKHNTNIAMGFTKPAFEYFIALAKNFEFAQMLEDFTAEQSMKLLLDAEWYVRMKRADDFSKDQTEEYLKLLASFKDEIQNTATMKEALAFNAMTTGLQIGAG